MSANNRKRDGDSESVERGQHRGLSTFSHPWQYICIHTEAAAGHEDPRSIGPNERLCHLSLSLSLFAVYTPSALSIRLIPLPAAAVALG